MAECAQDSNHEFKAKKNGKLLVREYKYRDKAPRRNAMTTAGAAFTPQRLMQSLSTDGTEPTLKTTRLSSANALRMVPVKAKLLQKSLTPI